MVPSPYPIARSIEKSSTSKSIGMLSSGRTLKPRSSKTAPSSKLSVQTWRVTILTRSSFYVVIVFTSRRLMNLGSTAMPPYEISVEETVFRPSTCDGIDPPARQ